VEWEALCIKWQGRPSSTQWLVFIVRSQVWCEAHGEVTEPLVSHYIILAAATYAAAALTRVRRLSLHLLAWSAACRTVLHVALEGPTADVVLHSAAAAVSCRYREGRGMLCCALLYMWWLASWPDCAQLSNAALLTCMCGMHAYVTVCSLFAANCCITQICLTGCNLCLL
jgi:hypothetical protein